MTADAGSSGELLAALIGAGAATLGTLALEFLIRPMVTRRRVAAVLRIEIQANRQALLALEERWKSTPGAIPPDLYFDVVAFQNLATSLGELKTTELVPTLELYQHLMYLMRLAEQYQREWEITRSAESSTERKQDANARVQNIPEAFRDSAAIALDRANTAFSLLDRIPGDRLGAPGMDVRRYERHRQDDLRRRQRP